MMANHMKHMPSLPTLASALCHIATIAVVMRGRTDLGTAPASSRIAIDLEAGVWLKSPWWLSGISGLVSG